MGVSGEPNGKLDGSESLALLPVALLLALLAAVVANALATSAVAAATTVTLSLAVVAASSEASRCWGQVQHWCVAWCRAENASAPKKETKPAAASKSSLLDLALALQDFVSYDTYVFDCDGVIWGIDSSDTASAVETVNYLLSLGKRVMFVTNNSNKSRVDFLRELRSKGIDFGNRDEEEKLQMMISASYTTAQYLKQSGLRHPFVITSDQGLLEELRLAGIERYLATIDEAGNTHPLFESPLQCGTKPDIPDIIKANPNVDCVVVGWDRGFTARKIGTAVNFIRFQEESLGSEAGFKPMPIIACSGDASGCFGRTSFRGTSVMCRAVGNGAMAAAIAACFDPCREWVDMGKPSEALLRLLSSPEAYGVDFSKALMIGDTVQTDIVFGNRGGMDTLLVFSGVTSQAELHECLLAGDPERVPTYVLPKLGSFAEQGLLRW